jgi:hypothetical protein
VRTNKRSRRHDDANSYFSQFCEQDKKRTNLIWLDAFPQSVQDIRIAREIRPQPLYVHILSKLFISIQTFDTVQSNLSCINKQTNKMPNTCNSASQLSCTISCGYKRGRIHDPEILLKAESNWTWPWTRWLPIHWVSLLFVCLFLCSYYAVQYKLGFNIEFVYFVNLFNKLVLTLRGSAITNNVKSDSEGSKQNFSQIETHPFAQYRM